MTAADAAVRLALCFLLGSIPFAVLAMAGTGIDIRRVGSGNPGFNNVLRVSKSRAVLTLLGDTGKGVLAIWLCSRPGDPVLAGWIYGFATVLGHCYTPWLRFRGGKGIATSGGVMLVLYPAWAALALAFFALVRIAGSRLHWKEAGAIASLATWVLFFGLMVALFSRTEAVAAGAMTVFLAWRHRQNFRNLVAAGGAR
jgi:glycerol-3-phosphate acyltransferase PlsY